MVLFEVVGNCVLFGLNHWHLWKENERTGGQSICGWNQTTQTQGADLNEALTGAGHAEQLRNQEVGAGAGYDALATVKEREVCRMDGRKNKDPLTENHRT